MPHSVALARRIVLAVAAFVLFAVLAGSMPARAAAAPSVKLTKTPTAVTRLRTATFAFTVKPADAATTCKLDSKPAVKCSTRITLSKLGNGTHIFTVTAKSGGKSSKKSYTWRVDSIPPAATIDSFSGGADAEHAVRWVSPALTVNTTRPGSLRVQVTATDAGGSGVKAVTFPAVFGLGAVVAAAPYEYTWSWGAAATAPSALSIVVADVAGNTTTLAFTAGIDVTGPGVPTVEGGSLSWGNPVSMRFAASGSTDAGSGVDGYEHRVSADGVTWSAAVSGDEVTITDEGDTRVQFRAVDLLGNAGDWSASAHARIDRTAPSAASVVGGSNSWAKDVVTLAGSSTDGGGSGVDATKWRWQVSADGEDWSDIIGESGPSLTLSAEGERYYRAAAEDVVGNVGGWSTAAARVRIDVTAPDVEFVDGGSESWGDLASVHLSASSSDSGSGVVGREYRVSADGVTWGDAVSGDEVTITDEGDTRVQFRAVDLAGNVSDWSATAHARIDRTAPSAASVDGGSNSWANDDVTLQGGASDDGSGVDATKWRWQVSADGEDWSDIIGESGLSLTLSAEGERYYRASAEDVVGHVGDWSSAARVRIDVTRPTTSPSGGSSTWTKGSRTIVANQGDDRSGVASVAYAVSTNAGQTWSIPVIGSMVTLPNVDQPADASFTVRFTVTDNAGNQTTSTVTSSSTANIDRSAPTGLSVSGGSDTWRTTSPVILTAQVNGGLSGIPATGYEWQSSSSGTGPWSTITNANQATYSASGNVNMYYRFRATDNAGNTSAYSTLDGAAAPSSARVRIDLVKPSSLSVSGGSDSWISASSVTLTASAADSLSKVDPSSYEWQSSPTGITWSNVPGTTSTLSISTNSDLYYRFRVKDNAGNQSLWSTKSSSARVRLDLTTPSDASVSGGSDEWRNANVTLTGSSTDSGSGIDASKWRWQVSPDGADWSDVVGANGVTLVLSADGERYYRARAQDVAGNVGGWSSAVHVLIDATKPSDASVSGGGDSWANQDVLLEGSSEDAGSGIDPSSWRWEASPDGMNDWSSVDGESGPSLTLTAAGDRYYRVAAVDVVGNVGDWSPTARVRIDLDAPTITILGGGDSVAEGDTVTISILPTDTGGSGVNVATLSLDFVNDADALDAGAITCSLDEETGNYDCPFAPIGLAGASYTLTASVSDNAGNPAAPASGSVIVT